MAAIFHSYIESNNHFFKGGLTVVNSVKLDFLEDLVTRNSLAIITEVAVHNQDIIQYFVTFDDVISYFYFGKGLGTVSVSGIIFTDCNGQMPGMDKLHELIGEYRGQIVKLSMGNRWFDAVLTSFSTVTSAEPNGSTDFRLELSIVNHNLKSPTYTPNCK